MLGWGRTIDEWGALGGRLVLDFGIQLFGKPRGLLCVPGIAFPQINLERLSLVARPGGVKQFLLRRLGGVSV